MSRSILNKIERSKGEKSAAYRAALVGVVPAYVVIWILEKMLWTRIEPKLKNTLVALLKAYVAFKVAGVLGSSMELEVLPEVPSMPDVEGAKEQAEFFWDRREELWDALSQSIQEITTADVVRVLKNSANLQTFFELAGMGNSLAFFLSLERMVLPNKEEKKKTKK